MLIIQEGTLALVALLWASLRGIPVPLRWHPDALIWGIGGALALLMASGLILWTSQPLRDAMAALDALLLRPLLYRDALLLAVLSGVGEEWLFRGVIQAEWGILPASVLFALLHIPERRMWIYGLWALFAGMFLGNLYDLTGNLLVPMVAHIVNNGLGLVLWKRLAEKKR